MGTILVLAILAVIVGLALRGMYRDKKQGKTCGSCSCCSGGCSGCSRQG